MTAPNFYSRLGKWQRKSRLRMAYWVKSGERHLQGFVLGWLRLSDPVTGRVPGKAFEILGLLNVACV